MYDSKIIKSTEHPQISPHTHTYSSHNLPFKICKHHRGALLTFNSNDKLSGKLPGAVSYWFLKQHEVPLESESDPVTTTVTEMD